MLVCMCAHVHNIMSGRMYDNMCAARSVHVVVHVVMHVHVHVRRAHRP